MICKCTHEIKVFLKEGKKKFKHVRTVRGTELTTISCQEGDCKGVKAEQEEVIKCGNSGERGRCKERAEWVWSHEPNQTDRLSLCTEHKEKAERDPLHFGYFRRI